MPSYPKPRRSKNKYSSVRQTYRGNSYHSKAEAKYAMYLDQRVKDKEIKGWEKQKKIELFGRNGTRVCNYYMDFVVEENDGSTTYIEVKGFKTPLWNLKRKLMEDKIKGMDNCQYIIEWV
jgi:hypothetical protein